MPTDVTAALPDDFSNNAVSASLTGKLNPESGLESLHYGLNTMELESFGTPTRRPWLVGEANMHTATMPMTSNPLSTRFEPTSRPSSPRLPVRRTQTGVDRKSDARKLKRRILLRRLAAQKRAKDEIAKGNGYFERREYQDALEHYERALEAMPQFADARIAAGNALFKLGRLEEAAVRFEQVAIFHPERASA